MSKIKDLIEFLRLDRRHEEAEAKSQGVDQTKVTVTTIDTNETRVINRTEFENSNIYLRIVNPLDKYKPTDFYVLPQIEKSIYYIKIDDCVDGFNYLNLENSRCEKVDDEQLLQKIEIGHATNHYFYDKNNREVVFSSENIEEVAVFGDRILFDPEKLDITTGTYSYSYSKPITTFCQFINGIINIIKLLENPFLFLSNGDKKKDVNVYVKQKGSIFLIPTISSIDDYFYATYYYTSSGKKMFYQINNTEDVAIQLEFNGKEPFLSFLNETIFTQQYFDYLDENVNERRIEFISKFKQLIIAPLEKEMNSNSEAAFYDAMVTLYYLTDTIALTLSNDTLWKLFETGISRNSLNNNGELEEENIYLKLLEAIASKETTKIAFLNRLLRKKGNTTTTYLEFLFNSIHGDNGTAFAKLVNKVWKQSRFVIPDSNQNKEFLTTNGPIILPYESEKWLGFYFSNAAVDFDDENQIAVSIKTGHYEEVINTQSRTAVPYMKEIPANFNYHPFHPIYIKNVEKQETSLKLDAIVPAFMLMANQSQQFWHNVIKTGEYGLDVITTFSGIGNLAKFRYLARLGEASSIIAKVKLGVGLVEVTSGVTNILLKLTGFEDTELGKSIQEYLFWLELLSLSGEITVAIKNGLKKSAKDALTHSDDLEKHLDEVVIEDGKASRKLNEAEKGKFWDEIKEVAEIELRKQKVKDIYEKGYNYSKVGMPDGATIQKIFSTKGNKLVAKVEQRFKQFSKLSKTKKADIVLVNGTTCRKYIDDVILHTNFPDSKLKIFIVQNKIYRGKASIEDIKKIYKYYLQEAHIKYDMHPFIEKRLMKHFDELKKGIKYSSNYNWAQTGGLPGVHAEVLSINEMLWRVEQVMQTKGQVMTESIFTEMISYNKNLDRDRVMIRCGDCNFLTYDVPFIEKVITQ